MAPKNKPNAFLFFMIDWKKQQEKKGKYYPNGIKDVQQDAECNFAWKNLDEKTKEHYKSKAKNEKHNVKTEKLTGIGEKLCDVERQQMKKQEFEDNMREYIDTLIRNNMHNLGDLKFYVIHVNFFYLRMLENNEPDYHPAEIALAEFSLKDGITNVYNEIISEKIKLGYSSEARETSSTSHCIPVESEFGEDDYFVIYDKIMKLINPGFVGGKCPPIYTLDGVKLPVESLVKRVSQAAGISEDYFKIYSFEHLFSCLYNSAMMSTGAVEIEDVVAKIQIMRDPFAYKPGLECDYHGDLQVGVIHCSQSYIKRWIYIICGLCCQALKIEMFPGFHMPKRNANTGFVKSLNTTLSTMSLNDSRSSSRSSNSRVNGLSQHHKEKVPAARSTIDEPQRKTDSIINVIDYSKMPKNPTTFEVPDEAKERPLRTPFTKSSVALFEELDNENIDFSENSFPSISMGRGAAIKKRQGNDKGSGGHGYASALRK